VKKGQFLAPLDMKNVAEKIAFTGNERILLARRGPALATHLGFTDFRSLPIMAKRAIRLWFDATHIGPATAGGKRNFIWWGTTLSFNYFRTGMQLLSGVPPVFIETSGTKIRTMHQDGLSMVQRVDDPRSFLFNLATIRGNF